MFKFVAKLILFLCFFSLADHYIADFLVRGLDKFYGLNKDAEVLCIGNSHTDQGIDGLRLERGLHVPVAKYAVGGANVFDRFAMIRHYFNKYPHSVKVVVYDVDGSTLSSSISSHSYKNYFPFMDDGEMEPYLKQTAGSWSEFMSRKYLKTLRFPVLLTVISLRSRLGMSPKPYLGKVSLVDVNRFKPEENLINPLNLECFEQTLKFLRARNVKIVLLYIPSVDVVANAERKKTNSAMKLFEKYAQKDSSVILTEDNKKFENRYELFNNPTHMNRDGQVLVTDELVSNLRNILR